MFKAQDEEGFKVMYCVTIHQEASSLSNFTLISIDNIKGEVKD
jgi:hypothetical protein